MGRDMIFLLWKKFLYYINVYVQSLSLAIIWNTAGKKEKLFPVIGLKNGLDRLIHTLFPFESTKKKHELELALSEGLYYRVSYYSRKVSYVCRYEFKKLLIRIFISTFEVCCVLYFAFIWEAE